MKIVTPVNMIITNDVSELLLIKVKSDFNPDGELWSIPGGIPKVSETYEDALMRVVEEQLSCRVRHYAYFRSSYFESRKSVHYRSIFYAGKIAGEMMLSDKVEESQWFTFSDIQKKSMGLVLNHREILLSFIINSKKQKVKVEKSKNFNT